ncbi:MAG: Signal transduction histidine kinase, LytS [Petrotoga mobilis]|nr:MAG: Signal transduction histidine kinase, LytS [Petrotoga mobilis]
MLGDITINLLERLSLVLVTTYLIFQTYVMRNIVGKRLFLKNKITIGIIGGFIGIVGTLSGINYNGAIVNFRDIGVILAGILGNIPGGVVAALISTTFRMFIGGITAIPCSLGTLTAGFISGVISKYHGREHFTFLRTLLYTTILEVVHLTYVLVMVKPAELAFEITFNILFPMILTNALGVSFFNFMIINIENQLQFTEENTMNSIFLIMEKSLSFAEKGLNKESANVIAKVILENTNFDAIALTNKDVVLAHVGSGSDHHISEWPIIDQMTKKVINSGRELTIVNREGIKLYKKGLPVVFVYNYSYKRH